MAYAPDYDSTGVECYTTGIIHFRIWTYYSDQRGLQIIQHFFS